MTYLITFACYGCHLHGHAEGSVDRKHSRFGGRLVEPDPRLVASQLALMKQPSYQLDEARREIVLAALIERCSQNRWPLIAAHVRSNHVHVVVDAPATPERVMNDLKSFANRKLNQAGFDEPDRKRWARHGSTRRLFDRDSILAAIEYVVDKQGPRMSVYEQSPLLAVTAHKDL